MLSATLPTGLATYRLANFNRINSVHLASSITRIASGQRVSRPKDNTGDYFRAQRINHENTGYQRVLRDISGGMGLVQVADKAGEEVFNRLTRMRELVDRYYSPTADADMQAAYQTEFDTLKTAVDDLVANTYYDSRQIIADTSGDPLMSVNLDPTGYGTTLDITFDANDVVSAAGLDITAGQAAAEAAVDAQLGRAGSYLGKVSAYKQGLGAHRNRIENAISTNEDYKEVITGADMAEETAGSIDKMIANETSFAMLAQANIAVSGVLALFTH